MSNLTLTFKVESLRKIPNPYLASEDGEKSATMYIAICDVKNLPDNIPLETNPREQKLTTGVPKKIKASLLDESFLDFYLLNRGLCISAKEVTYNNYTKDLTVYFEDFEYHGDIDGGHTYKVILENRDKLDRGKQYVKLEFLTGVENIFQRLAAARNTSTQVQDKSIAELENRFDIIKTAIKGERYLENIYFRENESGDIDVADLLAILNLFNLDEYSNTNMNKFPISSYSSKKKCVDLYINAHKQYGEARQNPYVKMSSIMKDIFKLYDKIEVNMNNY
jgi:AIPR protein.